MRRLHSCQLPGIVGAVMILLGMTGCGAAHTGAAGSASFSGVVSSAATQARPGHSPAPAPSRSRATSTVRVERTGGVHVSVSAAGDGNDAYAWALSAQGLLLSDDGGATWRSAAAPGDPSSYVTAARSGSDVVWLASISSDGGVALEHSTDGGKSWSTTDVTTVPAGQQVDARLSLNSPTTGAVVVSVPQTAMSGDSRLFVSTDAGRTFTAARELPVEGAVAFTSPTAGILVGSEAAADQVFSTTDGGVSWQRSTVSIPEADWLVGAPLTDSLLPITLQATDRHAQAQFMLASSGGGAGGFRPVGVTVSLAGDTSTASPLPATVHGENVWVLDGQTSTLATSSDLGRTWSVTPTTGLPAGVIWLAQPTPSTGLAMVSSGQCAGKKSQCSQVTSIYRSSDDGHTWIPVSM